MSLSDSNHDSTPAKGQWFTTTHWSVVLAAGDSASPQSAEALEKLCRIYWYPIYAFIRRRGYGPHEAQDSTQDFFMHVLEDEILKSVDPAKGKFRSFLLVSVKNFLAKAWNRQQAAKRGGQFIFVSWDAESAENCYRQEPSHDVTPEKIFGQTWATVLLNEVRKKLSLEYAMDGKGMLFEAMEGCLAGEKAGPYAEIASRLGMTAGAIKMAVLRMRQRYRELLRSEVAQLVGRPDEVEEELRDLLSCLGQ
jgi:RNA polymerase sigma-70 factor (ECF subfamily)